MLSGPEEQAVGTFIRHVHSRRWEEKKSYQSLEALNIGEAF